MLGKKVAKEIWNKYADKPNQWDNLGGDEKDNLISFDSEGLLEYFLERSTNSVYFDFQRTKDFWSSVCKKDHPWETLSLEDKYEMLVCGNELSIRNKMSEGFLSDKTSWVVMSAEDFPNRIDGYLDDLSNGRIRMQVHTDKNEVGVLISPSVYNGMLNKIEKLGKELNS